MMKYLLIAFGLLCLAASAGAQGHAYGVIGAGSLMQSGEHPKFAYFIGGDVPLYTDTAAGFRHLTRTTYYYANTDPGEEEVQAVQIWSITEKRFLTQRQGLTDWRISLGIGMSNEINDGSDTQNLAIKLELGATLVKSISLYLGGDVIPRSEETNQGFVYFGLNLKP